MVSPVIDKRFKQFRNGPEQLEAERQRKIDAIMKVAEGRRVLSLTKIQKKLLKIKQIRLECLMVF